MNYVLCLIFAAICAPSFYKGVHMLKQPQEERSLPAAWGILFISTAAWVYTIVLIFQDKFL